MKIAIYPGSFNPIHIGHLDVIYKAMQIFDKVIVAQGINPEKIKEAKRRQFVIESIQSIKKRLFDSRPVYKDVEVISFQGLLLDAAKKVNATAVIKGIRDTNDFIYEQKQQYWNEDLGITIPTMYIISDRKLVHVSSSAIRAIDKFKKE